MKAAEESKIRTWNITEAADGDVYAKETTPSQPGDYVGWITSTVYADGGCDRTYWGFVGSAEDVRAKFDARIL